jgi:hypothetical protein
MLFFTLKRVGLLQVLGRIKSLLKFLFYFHISTLKFIAQKKVNRMHMSKDYHLLRKFEVMFSDTNRYSFRYLAEMFSCHWRQESLIVC